MLKICTRVLDRHASCPILDMTPPRDFISEDDLDTFEGWMKYQTVDIHTLEPEELETWRSLFDQIKQDVADTPKVGRMKLQPRCDYRYAVAVEYESNLWLTLWVRRSSKGEFFVMLPRGDRKFDPHTSYHLNGNLHMKSHGHKFLVVKRQPLTGEFRGIVGLGTFYGHGPKGVGAVCDPSKFSGVVNVPADVLGPVHGGVSVDLVEPGYEPPESPWKNIAVRQVFQDFVPHLVITVGFDHARP